MYSQNLEIARLRQEEIMRMAAEDRLRRLALENQGKTQFYGPALARFGGWLVTFGAGLQEQYGQCTTINKDELRRKTLAMTGR